ncbi:TPA: hypothetical protein JG851_004782 [Vibrio parahaemolyticus]|nr:hypothetical protein [Vibrio parahaemolyticus]HBB9976766.1 hypothetical protein [Vibrio parahaemolyticus]HBC0013338.1 hypothetical protein [Vibrio parahaemolyticus]
MATSADEPTSSSLSLDVEPQDTPLPANDAISDDLMALMSQFSEPSDATPDADADRVEAPIDDIDVMLPTFAIPESEDSMGAELSEPLPTRLWMSSIHCCVRLICVK